MAFVDRQRPFIEISLQRDTLIFTSFDPFNGTTHGTVVVDSKYPAYHDQCHPDVATRQVDGDVDC